MIQHFVDRLVRKSNNTTSCFRFIFFDIGNYIPIKPRYLKALSLFDFPVVVMIMRVFKLFVQDVG